MLKFVLRRGMEGVVVMFFVTIITFLLVNLAPGGPAIMMRMDMTEDQRQALARRLDLDRPLHVRYVTWLGNAVRGDLGRSVNDGRHVSALIAQRLPVTLTLAAWSLAVAVILGIPLGVAAAVRRNGPVDYAASFVSVIGLAIPSFWFAILLIMLFSVTLNWLPSSGMRTVGMGFDVVDRLRYLVLPVTVLATSALPFMVRYTRSAMLGVIAEDYVRTARAKGVGEGRVYFVHAFRNALIPVVTQVGLLTARLIGGAVVTETIFGWPGLGRLAVEASSGRDFTVIMGLTIVIAAIVVTVNLLVDIAYGLIDPRIRHA
jgi:peptide/nickel transport system permease protein